MADMVDVALSLAAQGYSVIPIRPRDKRPALRSWTQYQTTAAGPEQIKLWFGSLRDINIGIITGRVSGIVVIDIDPKHGGSDEGFPPTNLAVVTGGGGQHLYYKLPAEGYGSYSGPGGIDVRGEGGYVVAPPSIHETGVAYEWDLDEEPGVITVEEIQKLAPRKNGKAGSSSVSEGDGVSEGNRNDSIARWTGHFVKEEKNLSKLLEKMQRVNLEKCDPPLPEIEVERTVRSIHAAEVKSITNKEKSKASVAAVDAEDDDGDMLPVIRFDEYALKYGGKTVQWLIPGYIPERTLCFIYGPPQCFKTWVEFDLAVSIATGLPFLGQEGSTPLRKGPVIILQQEDNHEAMVERIATIYMGKLGMKAPTIEEDGTIVLPEYDPAIPIYMFEERNFRFEDKDMIARLQRRIKQIKPVAVFFDPMYSFVPMDDYMIEAPGHMFPLKTLRDKYGCSFFIVHHTKKASIGTGSASGMMGSTFISAFAETRLAMDIVTGRKGMAVMNRTTKDASPRSRVQIKWDIYDPSSDNPGEWRYDVKVQEITAGQYLKLADPESMDFEDDIEGSVKPATEKEFLKRIADLHPKGMSKSESMTFPQPIIGKLLAAHAIEVIDGNITLMG